MHLNISSAKWWPLCTGEVGVGVGVGRVGVLGGWGIGGGVGGGG